MVFGRPFHITAVFPLLKDLVFFFGGELFTRDNIRMIKRAAPNEGLVLQVAGDLSHLLTVDANNLTSFID